MSLLAALVTAVLLATAPPGTAGKDPREIEARKECAAGRVGKGIDLLAELLAETGDFNHIYNQGRCYEENGRIDEAILRFREYLRKASTLDRADVEEARQHIRELEDQKARRSGSAPPPDAGLSDSAARPTGGSSTRRTAALVAGAVGLGGVGLGVAAGLRTHSLAGDVEKQYDAGKESSGRSSAKLQWLGYGIGAAGLATAAVLLLIGEPDGGRTLSLAPAVSGGAVGGTLWLRF
jgi:hypothetical protein